MPVSRFLTNVKRALDLRRRVGTVGILTIAASALDDHYLRRFDRRYHIRTSGFIELNQTSFEPTRLRQATNYGAVNGWAFKKLLKELSLPRHFAFTDLGSGLGRACILAAEYGFQRVTGVELAAEFCAAARDNIASCRIERSLSPITILQQDVLEYCDTTTDDVFFMYRPFAAEFFRIVLDKLATRSAALGKPIVVIFTERIGMPNGFSRILVQHAGYLRLLERVYRAQAFWVYRTAQNAAQAASQQVQHARSL